jgi:hypothetical protein
MAELNTYGDLKKAIRAISLKQKGEKIGNVAVDTILGAIPGIGAAKTTFDFVRAAFSKPDTKKTNTWLDKLDIDDEMSSIVDDTVENGFLKALSQTIDSESDDTPLESDFNMNAKMVDYLKRTYGGRTITGISEFKMKDRFQQLAGIKEEEIKSADVKSLVKLIDTNTTIKNKLQTVNNAQEVYEFLEYILNTINPKVSGVNVSKLKSIIDNRF